METCESLVVLLRTWTQRLLLAWLLDRECSLDSSLYSETMNWRAERSGDRIERLATSSDHHYRAQQGLEVSFDNYSKLAMIPVNDPKAQVRSKFLLSPLYSFHKSN